MVAADGHAKLTDFGVARFTEPDASQIDMTRAGQLIGTPSYMSPEQIQGQTIDRRSDVFSAGILFYQLLTWKKPFSGSQWELAKKIIEDDPVWPSKVVEIPPELDRVVARAMAKQPERRYQSARKFAEALQRVAEGKAPEEPGEILPTGKASEAEQEFWDGVKDSTDADEIALYVEQFPNGAFVGLAQKRIGELTGKKK
jgi:eukaryotic-like serine/threonine-protein kinase